MDKAFWQAILENDCTVPEGHSVASLTPELLGYLGSTDTFLRDEVAFEILAAWIARDGRYQPDVLRALGDTLARNLSAGLGEKGADSVFLRAFSVLVLDKVIEADNWRPSFPQEDIRRWMAQGLEYLAAEQDLRGYVPDKGWAHALAHSADLLWVLAQNRHMNATDLARILEAIADKVTAGADQVYLYGEDQRLAYAVMAALQRDLLDPQVLRSWLERLVHPAGRDWKRAYATQAETNAYQNTTIFLRSLYFQLLLGINPPSWYPDKTFFERTPALRDELLAGILAALRALDRGFYTKEPVSQ